jgi:ribosomal protein L34E
MKGYNAAAQTRYDNRTPDDNSCAGCGGTMGRSYGGYCAACHAQIMVERIAKQKRSKG